MNNFVEYAKKENYEAFKEYIEEMMANDRGQIGNEWHKAHSALYIDDYVEYSATVARAYKKALQAGAFKYYNRRKKQLNRQALKK